MPTLASKTVVITGAASGIGRALALELAAANADVWAGDIDVEALARLSDDASRFGANVRTRRADVTNHDDLIALRDAATAGGRQLDYWVNNAGIARNGGFADIPAAEFDRVLSIDLIGLIHGTRIALELMERQGSGKIVNMGSIAGFLPAPFMSSYNAAKFGVVGFTRSLSAELALRDSPVRTLLVSPGFVETPIISRGQKLGYPDWLSFILAKPETVAKSIAKAMPRDDEELIPNFNGYLMRAMYRMMPRATVWSSRMLLAKSWKDALLNRFDLT